MRGDAERLLCPSRCSVSFWDFRRAAVHAREEGSGPGWGQGGAEYDATLGESSVESTCIAASVYMLQGADSILRTGVYTRQTMTEANLFQERVNYGDTSPQLECLSSVVYPAVGPRISPPRPKPCPPLLTFSITQ